MILQCSKCNARYLVPDQAIGAEGRTVRCANCAHMWFQELPPQAQEALGELDQMIDVINARAEVKPKPLKPGANLPVINHRSTSLGLKAATVVAGLIAAALILLLAWPGLLGFSRSGGLVLADPGVVRLMVDKQAVYTINGKIFNSTNAPARAPTVRVTLMDDEGIAVHAPWNIRFSGETIAPGKSVPFTTGNMELPEGSKATRFAVDIGNPLELALRRKPE